MHIDADAQAREPYVIDGSDSQLSKDVSFRKADGGRGQAEREVL